MMNGTLRRQRLFLLTSCGGGRSQSFPNPHPQKEQRVTSAGDTVFEVMREGGRDGRVWGSSMVEALQTASLTPRKTPISKR